MAGLVKAVDQQIAKTPALKAFVVVLTDNADKTSDALQALAREQKVEHVPLTVIESLAGPPAYQIAREAEITVLLWQGAEVKANRAFAKGQFTEADIARVLGDLPTILKP